MDPDNWDGGGEKKALDRTQPKAAWEENHKHFTDEHSMNRALFTRFMAHLDANAVQSFQHEL